MRIGLYHGYELVGSGCNEYTRYISRALALLGHQVHVFCREPEPERIPHASHAVAWDAGRRGTVPYLKGGTVPRFKLARPRRQV